MFVLRRRRLLAGKGSGAGEDAAAPAAPSALYRSGTNRDVTRHGAAAAMPPCRPRLAPRVDAWWEDLDQQESKQ